ncbi:hypothetical protein RIF29_18916 [Crotalaria pallida]|uniref:Transcription initiation factor TFIID subunit 8 n=1 Tax=Crotalaria pallida TaxID=3830 RepID=A0AAN9I602_CROPI
MNNESTTDRAQPGVFSRAVSTLAVSQLCHSAGFHSATHSALSSFSDVTLRYLIDLAKTAQFYANLSGRSQCTVFDLILSLQDLHSPLGFANSQNQDCLVNCSVVRELVNYVDSASSEIPFEKPIPRFPVIRYRRNIPSFSQLGETPPSKHIPDWLPALPDAHTYVHTPVWNERVSDPREDKIEQARQRRKAERSLLSLQKRLLSCNGNGNGNGNGNNSVESSVPEVVVVVDDDDKNPMQRGNKDVSLSPVVAAAAAKVVSDVCGVEANNSVSVLEAFAPAIEVLKGGGGVLCDDGEEGREVVVPAVRPTVHFKFRTGKKLIGESLDTRHRNKSALRAASLAGREDERDDKKRRAEYILKQSMENTQELTLL